MRAVELDGAVDGPVQDLGGLPLGCGDLGSSGWLVRFARLGGSVQRGPRRVGIDHHVGEDRLYLLLFGQRLAAAMRRFDPGEGLTIRPARPADSIGGDT